MPNNNVNSANLKNNNDPAKRLAYKATLSQKMADRASRIIGSWPFIIILSIFMVGWIILNTAAFLGKWDHYPFTFLNLMLNIVAIYSAPVILMTQNREAERDRLRAINDLATDRKALREIDEIQEQLRRIEKKLDGK